MAKKELTLTLRAKNALAIGLGKGKKALAAFGRSAARIGKAFAKGFLIAGAALVAFSTKAVTAYAAQEKAERALTASLDAHAEAGAALLPRLKAIAAAIQDETGVGDENTLQIMANLRMLGVQTEQLGRASKGVIALTRAGLGNETAQKAMAAAIEGDFMQLTRYLPALRGATDATEKARIVNDFLTKGYEAQKGELDTVAGRWGALKGRIGDAWEEIGKAIAGNSALTDTLHNVGEAVKRFGERVAAWAKAGGFQRFQATAKFVLDDAAARVYWFAETTVTVFENISKIVSNVWRNMTDTIGHFLAKVHAKVTGQKWNIPPPEMRDVLAGVKELPEKGTEAYEEYAKRLAEIDKEIAASAEGSNRKRVDSAKTASQDILTAEERAAAGIKKLRKDQARLEKELAAGAKKAAADKIKALQDQIKKREELAKKTVKAFMDEKKAEKEHADALKADAEKADKLRAKQARGIKLSKKDRAFLEAFGEIEAARKAIKPGVPFNLAAQLAKAKAEFDEMKEQGKTLDKIRKQLADTDKKLDKLLRMA